MKELMHGIFWGKGRGLEAQTVADHDLKKNSMCNAGTVATIFGWAEGAHGWGIRVVRDAAVRGVSFDSRRGPASAPGWLRSFANSSLCDTNRPDRVGG